MGRWESEWASAPKAARRRVASQSSLTQPGAQGPPEAAAGGKAVPLREGPGEEPGSWNHRQGRRKAQGEVLGAGKAKRARSENGKEKRSWKRQGRGGAGESRRSQGRGLRRRRGRSQERGGAGGSGEAPGEGGAGGGEVRGRSPGRGGAGGATSSAAAAAAAAGARFPRAGWAPGALLGPATRLCGSSTTP